MSEPLRLGETLSAVMQEIAERMGRSRAAAPSDVDEPPVPPDPTLRRCRPIKPSTRQPVLAILARPTMSAGRFNRPRGVTYQPRQSEASESPKRDLDNCVD
ncbi:MAG: hypothetical protein ACYTEK_07060 [Planctomycetota bacterium]